ncbi:hypothetical protein D3C81_1788020 [compost metagenome]
MAVGGLNHAFVVHIALDQGGDARAAGQRDVAVAAEQTLGRHMQRHQRGRAGAVDADRRSLEVQTVGNARGGKLALIQHLQVVNFADLVAHVLRHGPQPVHVLA